MGGTGLLAGVLGVEIMRVAIVVIGLQERRAAIAYCHANRRCGGGESLERDSQRQKQCNEKAEEFHAHRFGF